MPTESYSASTNGTPCVMPMSEAEAFRVPQRRVIDKSQVALEVPKLQAHMLCDNEVPAEVDELHKQSSMARAREFLRSRESAGERTRKNASELDVLMAHRVDDMGDSRLKVLEAHKLQEHIIHAKSKPYRSPRAPRARKRSVMKAMVPTL